MSNRTEPHLTVSALDILACRALDRAAEALRAGDPAAALEWMNHATALRELERTREAEVVAAMELGLEGSGP